ncbi:hypothetical protein Tcan_00803, partial [Toxocara canis]
FFKVLSLCVTSLGLYYKSKKNTNVNRWKQDIALVVTAVFKLPRILFVEAVCVKFMARLIGSCGGPLYGCYGLQPVGMLKMNNFLTERKNQTKPLSAAMLSDVVI